MQLFRLQYVAVSGSFWTSFGTETWETPRSRTAWRRAFSMMVTVISGSAMVLLKTVTGRKNASWSISWNPPGPVYCISTCPFSEMTEALSSFAS